MPRSREVAAHATACYLSLAMEAQEQWSVDLVTRGDTRRLGRRLADCLQAGDLVLLEGPLGAGKTFLARSIARGLGVPAEVRITSPTFDLVHDLPGRIPVAHVDLYRLDDASGLADLGFLERIGTDAVVLVEWGGRFAAELGADRLWLELEGRGHATRRCTVRGEGRRGRALARALAQHARGAGHSRGASG